RSNPYPPERCSKDADDRAGCAIAASPSRLNSASRTVLRGSSTSAERSRADLESKTIQSVSALQKTAAAVGSENGKLNLRLAPCRDSSTGMSLFMPGRLAGAAGVGTARAAGTDFGAGAGASAAGAGLGAVVAGPAAGAARAIGATSSGGADGFASGAAFISAAT